MKIKKPIHFTAILLLYAIACVQTNSPFLEDYQGDYRLDVHISAPSDSLQVLKPFEIIYRNAGRDRFQNITIKSEPVWNLDTSILNAGKTDTSLILYFVKPFTGGIIITGERPNKVLVKDTLSLTVANPFRITGVKKTGLGQSISLQIASGNGELLADWFIDGQKIREQDALTAFLVKSDTARVCRIFALVKDMHGNSISTDTIEAIFETTGPVVHFTQASLDVPVGEEVTFPVQSSNCDSIRWIVKNAGIDTTVSGSFLYTFTSATVDTVIATGLTVTGVQGQPDTLIITAAFYTYSLQPFTGQFPDTVRVGHWAAWKMSVLKNGVAQTGADIVYQWKVVPDSSWDSLIKSGDGSELYLLFRDSIPSLDIMVRAKIGGSDSTYWFSRPVITRVFRPVCFFTTADCTTLVNVEKTVTVKAEDSNENGRIDSVFYMTSDNAVPVRIDGAYTFAVTFPSPGQKTVKCWAFDDDGNTGDTAILHVNVTDDHPYFLSPFSDTVVYTGSPLHLTVHAVSRNASDTVKAYRWDFDTNGIWDYTAQVNSLDMIFNSPGLFTFKVGCVDNRGDSGSAVISITVLSGAPVIDSLVPRSTWINDDSIFTIYAHDINGTVQKWYYDIDNDMFWDDSASTNTFNASFGNSGDKNIRIGVRDNDGILTTGEKEVNVRIGKPAIRAKSFGDSIQFIPGQDSIDTLFYVNHSSVNVTVRIEAYDTNGQCVRYYWDWGANGTINATTTGAVTTYALGEGLGRSLLIWCKDDDSLSSDSLLLYVYHDAPPPVTVTNSSRPGMPNIRLAWYGLDVHDDSLTQFAVVVGASAGTINDTVVTFTEANNAAFEKIYGYLTYTFNPQTRGIQNIFYYKIITRDSRGSMPANIPATMVIYPY